MTATITRETAQGLVTEIQAALAPIEKKYGVALACESTRFAAGTFTTRIEGRPAGQETKEQQETREQRERYQRNAGALRLPPLGSEFAINRETYLIRGMKRATKNNIVIERKRDAKIFVCPHIQLPKTKTAPTMPLADFVKAVNALQQAEVNRLNTEPGRVFGAAFHPYPEITLKHYHAEGMTPHETIDSITAEAEAEGRAEARASQFRSFK